MPTSKEKVLMKYIKEREKINRTIDDLESSIQEEKEKKCKEHNFEYYCTYHNSNIYICTKCGKHIDR